MRWRGEELVCKGEWYLLGALVVLFPHVCGGILCLLAPVQGDVHRQGGGLQKVCVESSSHNLRVNRTEVRPRT